MGYHMITQMVFNGVMLGIVFSLIALGLVLVLSIMNVVNFAHGEFYTIGGFMAYFVFDRYLVASAGWPPLLAYFVAFLLTAVVIGVFGFVIEKVVMRPFRENLLMGMMATVALSILFSMGMAAGLGGGSFNVSYPLSGAVSIWGANVSKGRLLIMLVGGTLCVIMVLFINKSKLGKAMRACMQNREVAQLQGIDYGLISALAFGIGCSLAAVSGLLIVPSGSLNAFAGGSYLMKSFIIIIIGGLGSLPGTIAAGFLMGFVESFGSFYLGLPVVNLLSFVLIIIVLIIRPRGLMGRAD